MREDSVMDDYGKFLVGISAGLIVFVGASRHGIITSPKALGVRS